MSAAYPSLVDRIVERLQPINEEIAALALTSGKSHRADTAFHVDGGIVGSVIGSFREDRALWADFRRALAPYLDALSHKTQQAAFRCQALAVADLQAGIVELQASLPQTLTADQRQQLRRDLNRLQRELRRARHVENLSRLAERINRHLEMPLVDGLLLRALAQVFGEDPDLWRVFQLEVDK
jgi:hypothetical protein